MQIVISTNVDKANALTTIKLSITHFIVNDAS